MSHHNHHFEDHCRPEPHHDHHSAPPIFIDHCDRGNQHVFNHCRERFSHHNNGLPSVVVIINTEPERYCPPPVMRVEPWRCEPPPVVVRCEPPPVVARCERPLPDSSFFVRNPNTNYDYDSNDFIPDEPALPQGEPIIVRSGEQLTLQQRENCARIAEEEAKYNALWGPENSAGYRPGQEDESPREAASASAPPVLEAPPVAEAPLDARAEAARQRELELDAQWGPEHSAGYDPNDNAPRPEPPRDSVSEGDYAPPQLTIEDTAAMARDIAEHVPLGTADNF